MNEMLRKIIEIRHDEKGSVRELTENRMIISDSEKTLGYAYQQGMLVISHERTIKNKPDMDTLNRMNNLAILGKHIFRPENSSYCFQWESRIGDDCSENSLRQIVSYSENQFALGYKILSSRGEKTRERALKKLSNYLM